MIVYIGKTKSLLFKKMRVKIKIPSAGIFLTQFEKWVGLYSFMRGEV
jgi:hypothetical protein